MNQLEGQTKDAQEMVYRWFRFSARRGRGVLYALLSLVPLLGYFLNVTFADPAVALVGAGVAAVCSWSFSRAAGSRSFAEMTYTIEMMKGNSVQRGWNRSTVVTICVPLLPYFAYDFALLFNQTTIAALIAVFWLVEMVLYRISLRSVKDRIADSRIEDWLVIVALPVSALLAIVPTLHSNPLFSGFLLLSPILLLSGIKSLYDAPKELVMDLDAKPE